MKYKTLSQVIAEQSIERIYLLKIDVAKAELDVIEGIKEEYWAKIQQIVMEVHNINNRLQKIIKLLKSQGFSQINYQEDSV
ncbi:methyltransferase FkbM family protein [Chondrocystis sp. NIES-4102]|nr:methyltransferase FkbM family protein [Chondrocystis sp. NIES-4102]